MAMRNCERLLVNILIILEIMHISIAMPSEYDLRHPDAEKLSQLYQNPGFFGGDMRGGMNIPESPSDEFPLMTIKETDRYKYWPHGILFYEFSSENYIDPISWNTAVEAIQLKTCLRIVPRNNTASITSYVKVTSENTGCWSYVGMDTLGAQVLNLQWPGCWVTGTIIHELLHAFGLIHQHQRYDRDNYITIKTQNVESGSLPQFDIIPQTSSNDVGLRYDFDSIMHYGSFAFGTYISGLGIRLQTIVVKNDPTRILLEPYEKNSLSFRDTAEINLIYASQCQGTTSKTSSATNSTTTASRKTMTTAITSSETELDGLASTSDDRSSIASTKFTQQWSNPSLAAVFSSLSTSDSSETQSESSEDFNNFSQPTAVMSSRDITNGKMTTMSLLSKSSVDDFTAGFSSTAGIDSPESEISPGNYSSWTTGASTVFELNGSSNSRTLVDTTSIPISVHDSTDDFASTLIDTSESESSQGNNLTETVAESEVFDTTGNSPYWKTSVTTYSSPSSVHDLTDDIPSTSIDSYESEFSPKTDLTGTTESTVFETRGNSHWKTSLITTLILEKISSSLEHVSTEESTRVFEFTTMSDRKKITTGRFSPINHKTSRHKTTVFHHTSRTTRANHVTSRRFIRLRPKEWAIDAVNKVLSKWLHKGK